MKPPLVASLIDRLQKARFLSVSLVIHLVLGLTLGGVVLFKATQDQQAFVVADSGSFLTQGEEPTEQMSDESIEFEEPSAPSAETASAVSEASAIQSLTNTASFEMNVASPVQTMGSAISGNLSPSLSAGTGVAGGKSKLSSGSFFGVANIDAKGLIGTFYDLKQTESRKPTGMDREKYLEVVSSFVRTWNPSRLGKYFQSPTKLVSSQIFTPNISADLAPKAFGVEKDVQPSLWVAWYRARISPPKSGTYHFVGAGDDVLFVRLNGKTVLDRSWYLRDSDTKNVGNYDYGFSKIKDGFAKGAAFKAEKGQFYDLDILIGEQPGGLFYASVLIEEAGATYEKDAKGNPILPIFRVADELPSTEGNPSYPPHAKNGPIWEVQAPKK